MDWGSVLDILKESALITLIVTALMLGVEALDFALKGRMLRLLRRSGKGGVAASSLLGAVPGCAGGYLTVSMYSRGMFSFGALLAMMISTTGDEAFLMLALFPGKAAAIMAVLALLGLASGLVCDRIRRKRSGTEEFRSRDMDPSSEKRLRDRLLHVLPHALRVFAWTFGIMFLVEIAGQHTDLAAWLQSHKALGILAAVVIGLIPTSGPHMAFVKLFADGMLPLSALVASCIVQEGHAGLPLLSCDRKAFLKAKAVKVLLALLIAGALSLAGL